MACARLRESRVQGNTAIHMGCSQSTAWAYSHDICMGIVRMNSMRAFKCSADPGSCLDVSHHASQGVELHLARPGRWNDGMHKCHVHYQTLTHILTPVNTTEPQPHALLSAACGSHGHGWSSGGSGGGGGATAHAGGSTSGAHEGRGVAPEGRRRGGGTVGAADVGEALA
eukprot:4725829-Prymnesium_polylepis.1